MKLGQKSRETGTKIPCQTWDNIIDVCYYSCYSLLYNKIGLELREQFRPTTDRNLDGAAMAEPQDNGQMILPFPPLHVVKSNALLRARWKAESVLEPRLIALLASKIEPDDEDFKVYDIHVTELLGKRDYQYGGTDLKAIEEAVEKAMSRVLTIRDAKGWTKYNVFFRCRFESESGMLKLGFHPDLIPHYLQLKQNFAKYNLIEFMMLPSVYSQRIFELLKSWKDQPEFVVSIDDLHEMLATPKSHRENFKAFRTRVLEKARTDIQKRTSLRYTWEAIKDGRRIGAIRFILTQNRMIESKIEEAKKRSAKAMANAKRNTAAFVEAVTCAKEKKGDCNVRNRAKRVCTVCDECNVCAEIKEKQQ